MSDLTQEKIEDLAKKPRFKPNHIRAIRYVHGITQEDLATQLDVSVQTIQNWEKGDTTPSPSHSLTLHQCFGHYDEVDVPDDWTAAREIDLEHSENYCTRLPPDLARFVDAYANEIGTGNKSEAMRRLLIIGIRSADYEPYTLPDEFDGIEQKLREVVCVDAD